MLHTQVDIVAYDSAELSDVIEKYDLLLSGSNHFKRALTMDQQG